MTDVATRRLLHAVASAALRYPTPDVIARRGELAGLLAGLGRSKSAEPLRGFLDWWRLQDPADLERTYVETFDLHKRCTLYLTYYLYGDRRQRGQEFLRLRRLFEGAGERLTGRELPDYLPLLLEFAALEPDAGAAVLWEMRVPLELLRSALREAASPWAGVVDAVCAELPALDPAGRDLVARLAAEGPPGEQVGLEPYGPPEAMPDAVSAPTGGPR